MQGKFSKIRGIFDSRRPVATTEYQVPGRWDWAIDLGQRCEYINNQQQKTRVIEYWSGVYQLWSASARKNFENQRNIWYHKTVTKTVDQGLGQCEQYIWCHRCESINNQKQKTRVTEDRSGVYQLWSASAKQNFENKRNIWYQTNSDDIIRPRTGSVGTIDLGSAMRINKKINIRRPG